MTYHGNNSLNLLQRIIGEGSDSSSGQDWIESGQLVESDSGKEEKASEEIVIESKKTTGVVPVQVKSNYSLCEESTSGDIMSKMGNIVAHTQESQEVVDRNYEKFLRGEQQDEFFDEKNKEDLLEKIEEESDDMSPVARVKSKPKHTAQVHHEFVDNSSNSTVASEECAVKKKTKVKKKRKVKKAFVMQQEKQEDDKLDGGAKGETNQENCEHVTERSGKMEDSTDQDSVSDRHEVMSDLGPSTQNQKRRKLTKRTPIRKFKSLEINPDLFYEDRLKQKYSELKELVRKGITEQQVSRQQLGHVEVLRQQYANASHGMPPSGRSVLRDVSARSHNPSRAHHQQREKSESDHAYSTIRMLQVTNSGGRCPRQRPKSAAPARQENYNNPQSRPKSAAPTRHDQPRTRQARPSSGQVESKHSSSRNNSQRSLRNRSYSPRNRQQNGLIDSPRSKSADSDSASEEHVHQHHVFPHSDNQLKNTDNDTIKEWLKKKNVIIKRQKAEERKKKREERKKEQVSALEKEKRHLASKEKVNDWMITKRHEAFLKDKEERFRRQKVMEEKEMEDSFKITMVSGQGFDYPPSPPLYKTKHVVRPGTTVADMQAKQARELSVAGEETTANVRIELNVRRLEEEEKQQTTLSQRIQLEGPHPPTTKFVYKRPVLGRVRLRVRPQQQTSDKTSEQVGRKTKFDKPNKKNEVRVRKSYDEWIAEKRVSDNERRKTILRKNKMTKSDPELERIVPQRRATNIIRGKKYISMGVKSGDNEVHKRYDLEELLEEATHKVVNEVLSSLEDNEDEDDDDDIQISCDSLLKVSKASLSTRPKSASAVVVPSLKLSNSPRRPATAKRHPRAIEQNGEQTGTTSMTKVPFPADQGVPKHVDTMQKKLFSPKLWENPVDGERPEPQGCDAVEQLLAMVTQEIARDCSNDENTSRSSTLSHDSMKFKRVSFCETTTVIEEDIPSTDAASPHDEEQLSPKIALADGFFITEDS